jgi:hypothetical protein
VRANFLSVRALEAVADARRQCAQLLSEAGLLGKRGGGKRGARSGPEEVGIEPEAWRTANENAGDPRILRALLVAGLYPNIARIQPGAKPGASPKLTCRASEEEEPARGKGAVSKESSCQLHPCSVAHGRAALPARWGVFLEQVKSTGVYLRDITPVTPFAMLLFGGELVVKEGSVVVDGWASFSAAPRLAVMFTALRGRLGALMERDAAAPKAEREAQSASLLEALKQLLASEPDSAF